MSKNLNIFYKYKSIFNKGNITILPENGIYDSVLIWLHGVGGSPKIYHPIFRDHRLLGVKFLKSFNFLYRKQK